MIFNKCAYNSMINIDKQRTWSAGTMRISSFLSIDTDGLYSFYMECVGCCSLYINDLEEPLIDKTDNIQLKTEISKIYLSSGSYDLVIYYSSINNYYTIKLFWDFGGFWSIIGPKYFKIKHQPPSFLSYESNAMYILSHYEFDESPIYLGYAEYFTCEGLLCDKINFDFSSGRIYGIIDELPEEPIELELCGYGIDGMDRFPLNLFPSEHLHFLSGIKVDYYLSRKEICDRNFTYTVGVNRLVYRSLSSNVNISEPGLTNYPNYFKSNTLFTVYYHGYIFIEKEGVYNITVNGYGPIILVINNFTNYSYYCGTNKVYINTYLPHGYNRIEIHYGHYRNHISISALWSSDELEIPLSVIPSSVFFYKTNYLFYYFSPLAIYIYGYKIEDNYPIYINDEEIVSYSIFPILPKGLTLNVKTGIISGTPVKEYVDMMNFIVTARTSSGKKYAATIRISIITVTPPDNIMLLVNNVPVKTLSGEVGIKFSEVKITANSNINSISTEPELPVGLYINVKESTISGTPIYPFIGTITFLLGNFGGYSYYQVYVDIIECSLNGFFYMKFSLYEGVTSYNISLTEINNSNIILDNVTITNNDKFFFCRDYSNYTLSFNKIKGYSITYEIIGVNDTILSYGTFSVYNSFFIHFSSLIDEDPKLSYLVNDIYIYSDHYNFFEPVFISSVSNIKFKNCSDTLHINNRGEISGTLINDKKYINYIL